VVNYHHRLPLTRASGSGIRSSSDGQRFPVKGKSIIARPVAVLRPWAGHLHLHPRFDQHSTYDTKVILAHIWPTYHENVDFYGTDSVDIDGELAQLDADCYRPLLLAQVATASG